MRRDERYQQLLRIARQLVVREGIDAVTMMAVSELAGVAKPVVYSHFANSSEIIIALMDEHFRELADFVRTQIRGCRTLEQYVFRLVDASFDFENASELPVRRITNGFSADEKINEAFLKHEQIFTGHWESLLRVCGASERQVEVAANAIGGMVRSTIYVFAVKPHQRVARETTKTLLLAMIEAVVPGGSRRDFHIEGIGAAAEAEGEIAPQAAPRPRARSPRRVA